jgi:leucyl aminopeptidase (aminopeptidase T)
VPLSETLLDATLVVAMTQFSATAPLAHLAERKEDFRAASMPGVLKRMEGSALAADYAVVARRCQAIDELMRPAQGCDVTFSTGHRCWFDLRDRHSEVDDGHLPRFKPGDRIINLPSGETFKVPYEGEREGQPSWTAGSIPVATEDGVVVFQIAGNRILQVEGDGAAAESYRRHFAEDPARANIAEVAFGVNDRAEVCGSVIEDEKAGFHWAFGRSDHLGGVFGVSHFRSPETVVHQDIVYAEKSPIQVVRATLIDGEGRASDVIRGGRYLL